MYFAIIVVKKFCYVLFFIFQGYKKRLNKIFEDAGLQLSSKVKEHLSREASENALQEEKQAKGDLQTVDQCQQVLPFSSSCVLYYKCFVLNKTLFFISALVEGVN